MPPRKAITSTRTRRRPIAKATFQAPVLPNLPSAKQVTPQRPTHHNGVEILDEQRIPSPLPHGGPFRITRLRLADGKLAHGCFDCLFTAETRGDIVAHRNAEHGGRVGKKAPKIVFERDPELLDVVLPPRDDGTPAPLLPIDMTLREIVTIAPSLMVLFNNLDAKERECEALREQLDQIRVSKADQHKIDVYDSHQQEIGELRALLAKQGNYEVIKEELYELRAWKKKFITKLKALGFTNHEED